jgi:SAM-dependent methyltransferase
MTQEFVTVRHSAAEPDTDRAVSAIARYYDLDFGGIDDDLEMYRNLAAGGRVLELGAGTGRIAAALAESGSDVVAVESNAAMREAGSERFRAAGVRVVEQDMRRLDLLNESPFDLAVCGLSTFCHLQLRADQLATLDSVARHLTAGGRAVFDLPALTADDWEEGPRPPLLEWTRELPSGHIVTKLATLEAHPGSQTQDVTYIYDEVGPGGAVERTLARFRLRHVFQFEMVGLLEAVGMRVTQIYGSYDLDPVEAGERLIVVAEREDVAQRGVDRPGPKRRGPG